jgi:hypothetical protein
MDRAFLEGLGLTVHADGNGVIGAQLNLTDAPAFNPLTRKPIEYVAFTLMGDRLIFVGPAELVGAQPIHLAYLTAATRLEELIVQTLSAHLFQLERRSNELSALGVSPKVDPATLQLSAELTCGPFRFGLGASRSGQFRVTRCIKDGVELTAAAPALFELSEFRSRGALEDFLYAMFSDLTTSTEAPTRKVAAELTEGSLPVIEVFRAFGEGLLPARGVIEIVSELRVQNERYRFAAARVQGRTFRGLLAGPSGKVWAERFELEEFTGIRVLVASVLSVPLEDVEVIG